MLLVLCNEEFKLRFKCFEVFVRQFSNHAKAERGPTRFLQAFNHRFTMFSVPSLPRGLNQTWLHREFCCSWPKPRVEVGEELQR